MQRRWLLVGLFLLNFAVTWLVHRQPDGYVHVWVLPEGQGLVLRTPEGRGVLVDTMPDPRYTQALLGRVLPPWRRELALVISTAEKDAGLHAQARVLEAYPANRGWLWASPDRPLDRAAWQHHVAAWQELAEGLTWEVDGVRWRVLAVTPPVLLMEAGRFQLVYAPRGVSQSVASLDALVWVVDRLPVPTASVFPAFVVTREFLPPNDANAPRQVLAHPETRFFLASQEVVHFLTDGQRYRWEVASLP